MTDSEHVTRLEDANVKLGTALRTATTEMERVRGLFTPEDVELLSQMLDHAERWINDHWTNEWDKIDRARKLHARIASLLPPRTP